MKDMAEILTSFYYFIEKIYVFVLNWFKFQSFLLAMLSTVPGFRAAT